MLSSVRAGHGQKPGEEGGRDYPLKRGRERGFVRSGLTLFGNDLNEMAGLADPRASELRAVKATLAEIGQSRDDWRRRLRFSGNGSQRSRRSAGTPALRSTMAF